MASIKCFIQWILENLEVRDDTIFLFDTQYELFWLQGVLIEVDKESQEAIVDDGTGQLVVTYANVKFIDPKLEIGQFVLVQGHVIIGENEETGEMLSYLDAKRLEPLYDPNYETLWQLEVMRVYETQCQPSTTSNH
eukprot:gene10864-12074_t